MHSKSRKANDSIEISLKKECLGEDKERETLDDPTLATKLDASTALEEPNQKFNQDKQNEIEMKLPYPCRHPGCSRRFRVKGNRQEHEKRHLNPNSKVN